MSYEEEDTCTYLARMSPGTGMPARGLKKSVNAFSKKSANRASTAQICAFSKKKKAQICAFSRKQQSQ